MDPLQAFRLIDARLDEGVHQDQLSTLRQRLAGELLGSPALVNETLAAGFELVTHTAGATAGLDRAGLMAAAGRLGSVLMWAELTDLAVDREIVAGQGLLRTLAGTSLTTMTIALFVRYDDDARMTSEVAYMNPQSQATVPAGAGLPSREQLRDLLGYPKE